MPTGLVINQVYTCKVNGTVIATSTDISQNEHLEDLTTMVADVEITNFPAAAAIDSGLSFQLARVNAVSGSGLSQFSGIVDNKDAVGFPNRVKLSAIGALSKLRRAPLADHVLTGMTDITAARHILTNCNVTYTSGDISGFGYTLGAVKPVIWKKGTTGLSMLQELDKVFACATMEIGDGRIVRFVYDRVPALGDASATYVKGYTLEYHGAERKLGGIDAIQNFWQIGGLSFTSDADGAPAASGASNTCQARYWGSAYAVNSKISGYSSPDSFSSDLIQSEGLAKQIAARMMRWWNREPDTVTVEAVNNPLIVPGMVISLTDPSYGVDLATATPYLILGIDRSFDTMKLACIGGAAGATGTVTGGLNVCCGTQQADGTCVENGSNPSVGSWPSPGFPPFPAFAPFDIPAFSFDSLLPPLVCPACDVESVPALPGADWALKSGTTGPWDFSETCMIAKGDSPTHAVFWAVTNTVADKLPIAGDKIVQFKGHVTWRGGEPNETGTSSAYLTFGLLSPDNSHDSLLVNYLINDSGGSAVSFAGSVGGVGNTAGDYSIPLTTSAQDFDFYFVWDPDSAGNYQITLTGGVEYSLSGTGANLTGGIGSVLFNSWSDGVLVPPIDVMISCMGYQEGAPGLTIPVWHTLSGSPDVVSETELRLLDSDITADPEVYADGDGLPFSGANRIVFSGHVAFSHPPAIDTDAPVISLGFIDNIIDLNFIGMQVQNTPTSGPFGNEADLFIYDSSGFVDQAILPNYSDAINEWDFSVDFNFPANTITVNWNSGATILSGALAASTTLYPYLAFAAGDVEIEAHITDLVWTVS